MTLTFQEWSKFFQTVGDFNRLPSQTLDDEEIGYLRKDIAFIPIALYEDVIRLRPGEVGLDAAHSVRIVRAP